MALLHTVRPGVSFDTRLAVPSIIKQYIAPSVLIGTVVVLLAYTFAFFALTDLPDWRVFWDAAGNLDDPYARHGFLNPYWVAWLISPIRLFADDALIGYGLWIVVVLALTIFVLKGNRFAIFASLTSPYFAHQAINGQIDIFVLVGYFLLLQSHWMAPALMLVKPQAMAGSLIVWGFRNIKRKVLYQSLLFLALLTVVGFTLYGNWIADLIYNVQGGLYQPVNSSFMFHCPVMGIGLLLIGTVTGNVFLGGLATLFLTPYIAMHSLWVYWTAWLMGKPNKYLIAVLAIANWYLAMRFT